MRRVIICFFCMWLEIHQNYLCLEYELRLNIKLNICKFSFDSFHSYGCGQAHLGIPIVIFNIRFAKVKTKLSYDPEFLHVVRHP